MAVVMVSPWFDADDLGRVLDQVDPTVMRGARRVEGVWFFHPDWQGVVCKYGVDTRGRLLRVWMLCTTEVVVLTVGIVGEAERMRVEAAP